MPEFGQNGKEDITIRQLLTHYSGLAPDLDLTPRGRRRKRLIQMAFAETPQTAPGAEFVYSDINFIVLGGLWKNCPGKRWMFIRRSTFFSR